MFRFVQRAAGAALAPIEPTDALVKSIDAAGEDDIARAAGDDAEATVTLAESTRVKALMVDNRTRLVLTEGMILAVGDGTNPAGVIFSESTYSKNYTPFEGEGTLDFGTSPGIVWKGIPTDNTGSGRGLEVKTRIEGSASVTFASRSTYANNSYCLVKLFDNCCAWTGPTYVYNTRLWLAGTTGGMLPNGGDVHILGGRNLYGAQLFAGGLTLNLHFHLSGYGASGYTGKGTDGIGAILPCGTLTFNGLTTLEDETFINALTVMSPNAVTIERGALAFTGPTAFAATKFDTDLTKQMCSSIGAGASHTPFSRSPSR